MNGKLSRRDALALTGAGLAGVTAAVAYQSPNPASNQPLKKLYAFVSSWTKGPFGVGGGGGISVFTVNMNDGTVSLFVVKPDGALEPACDVAVFDRTYAGAKGSPHAHSANFDPSGRFV